MERIVERKEDGLYIKGWYKIEEGKDMFGAYKRLCEYEETGLTPEEIKELISKIKIV